MRTPTLLDGARWRGVRIGLLGGSFDPPHEGHAHIARAALSRLELDAVWWLVAPRNPLKGHGPAALDARLELVRARIAGHPAMVATGIEAELGTRNTRDTVAALVRRLPGARFVWVGGTDSMATLHRWQRWRDLLALVPTLTFARAPAGSLVRRAPARALAGQRHVFLGPGVPARQALEPRTSYWALTTPMVEASSTALRAGA